MMGKTKLLLLNVVSIVTIASLITGCCSFPSGVNISVDEGGEITVSLSTPEPEEELEIYPAPSEVPWQPVEVVSERELTPEEFFQRVQGDEDFADVYALAAEEGYTEPETAGEFVMSDGSELRAIVLSSPAGERVVALRLERGERSGCLLAGVEPQRDTLVLYDREGRAEITVRDEETVEVRVFDAPGNPIGETRLPQGWGPPGLASPPRVCTGGRWDDFDHCCRKYIASGVATILACGAAIIAVKAAVVTGGWAMLAAIALYTAICPFGAHCLVEASQDDYPTCEGHPGDRLDTPCRTECRTTAGREGVLTVPNYRFTIDVDDDRSRRPPTPQYLDVCAGEERTLTITDCGGRSCDITAKPPVLPGDFVPCAEGKTCVQEGDNAECRLIRTPVPPPEPQPTITLGTGDVQITLRWGPTTPDIDLHVTDPDGVHIWYSDKAPSNSAGRLDVDDKCGDTGVASGGPENIFWPSGQAPIGTYRVSVIYYEDCTGDAGEVSFTVTTLVDGVTNTHIGRISPDSGEVVVTTFTR